jgi:hypothetical protein
MREIKIFCPQCRYVPRPSDRWTCISACGCLWNTFDTCGVCPKCGRNWEMTQCPRCVQLSPHGDWYHEETPKGEVPAKEPSTVPEPAHDT